MEFIVAIKKTICAMTEFVSLVKKHKDGRFAYIPTVIIVFVFLLIPNVPYIISNKLFSLLNKEYLDLVQMYTVPLIGWFVEINIRIEIIWLIRLSIFFLERLFYDSELFIKILNVFGIVFHEISRYLSGPALIISCGILDAYVIHSFFMESLSFKQKVWGISEISKLINTPWYIPLLALLPFALRLWIDIEMLVKEKNEEMERILSEYKSKKVS